MARGRFRTARVQRQLLRCPSREHPWKPPTHRSERDPFKTVRNWVLRLFLVPKTQMGCPKFFLIHLRLPLSTRANGKRLRVRTWKMGLCSGKKQPTARTAHSPRRAPKGGRCGRKGSELSFVRSTGGGHHTSCRFGKTETWAQGEGDPWKPSRTVHRTRRQTCQGPVYCTTASGKDTVARRLVLLMTKLGPGTMGALKEMYNLLRRSTPPPV